MSEEKFYYTSIYDLPLYNFIQIALHGDMEKWLVKPEVWEKMLLQFAQASGSTNIMHLFNVSKQIVYLTNRLNIIQLLVNQLTVARIEGLIELLRNDLGFHNLKFEDLDGDLKKVMMLSKSDMVRLKQAQKQYEDMQNKEAGAEVTEEDWFDEMAVLSKFQGFAIRPHETSVGEYLAIKKAYKRHFDQINKNTKTTQIGS